MLFALRSGNKGRPEEEEVKLERKETDV